MFIFCAYARALLQSTRTRRTTVFYKLSHYLASLRLSRFLPLAHTHTPKRAPTHKHSRLIAFPFFFLAERFMVGGMLETGYYHVPFELISQTKWPRWCRRHPRAFSPASPMPPFCALACVNPLCSGSALSHAASLKSSTVALCFPAIWPGVKCRMPRREAQIRVAEQQVYAATDVEEFGVDTKTF